MSSSRDMEAIYSTEIGCKTVGLLSFSYLIMNTIARVIGTTNLTVPIIYSSYL